MAAIIAVARYSVKSQRALFFKLLGGKMCDLCDLCDHVQLLKSWKTSRCLRSTDQTDKDVCSNSENGKLVSSLSECHKNP